MSKKEIEQFGVHLMIDGYFVPKNILDDKSRLLRVLQELPKELKMRTICEPVVVEVGQMNRKDPGGISGFIMISESHISFHSFPKRGFISLDIYTCQNELDLKKIIFFLKKELEIVDYDYFVQKRGLRYPVENIF